MLYAPQSGCHADLILKIFRGVVASMTVTRSLCVARVYVSWVEWEQNTTPSPY
jgi:hypothetical protein